MPSNGLRWLVRASLLLVSNEAALSVLRRKRRFFPRGALHSETTFAIAFEPPRPVLVPDSVVAFGRVGGGLSPGGAGALK